MSKYAKVTPFKAEHLELMDLREPEASMVAGNGDRYKALAEIGIGLTMMYDGRILGALGFLQLWEGVYEVWVIPTVHVTRYPRQFLRTVRTYLDTLSKSHAVHRFQSPAIADARYDKWMRHLGFRYEGRMPWYASDKQDFNMWGRLVE